MPLYTFAVGPSELYPQVAGFYKEAFEQHFAAESHRGKAFMAVFERAVSGIRQKLGVPVEYGIFFTGSATECWEMLSQTYAQNGAFHAFSGAFGEKWFEYGKSIAAKSKTFRFRVDDDPSGLLGAIEPGTSLIALTLNETSNGTALPFGLLGQTLNAHPDAVLAVDTTSIMAGVDLPWQAADVWFASVQKCFGLPAGMAVTVLSPKAIEAAKRAADTHYNGIEASLKFADIHQTPFTPNMLAIYSMARLMETIPTVKEIDGRLRRRAARLYDWLDAHARLEPLVHMPENRSPVVIAVKVPEGSLARYQEAAAKAGYELGRGYGTWKETTFRIANFPALDDAHLEALLPILDAVE